MDALMESLGRLVSPINRFFDAVLVDDDSQPEARDNRRALVQHIAELADGIANLALLEGF